MRVIETELPGVLVLEPPVHRDERGYFVEVFHEEHYRTLGLPARFVQDNQSRSFRGTLRGLHWQWRRPQAKLVRVLAGEVFDVAVDIRRGSPTFGQWVGIRMTASDFRDVFIPEGFAHGFCVLSDWADVLYKCTDFYDPGGESGLMWNDPAMGIEWPISQPLLSPRDAIHPPFAPDRPDFPLWEGLALNRAP
jgi:dTDP-4-dehydrorhamnose 3,5-epimerase